MDCFDLLEPAAGVRPPGLPLWLEPRQDRLVARLGPRIPGARPPITLHPAYARVLSAFATRVRAQAPYVRGVRLVRAGAEPTPQGLELRLLRPDDPRPAHALLRLRTSTGPGGRLWVTSTRLAGDGQLRPLEEAPGVELVGSYAARLKLAGGVSDLDVWLRLAPGASVRVQRTGPTEGAPAVFTVQWTEGQLRVTPAPTWGGFLRP